MRIEYGYKVEVKEPAGRELTPAEQTRLQSLMNAEMERIIADEIFGAYSVPDIKPVKSFLGFINMSPVTT